MGEPFVETLGPRCEVFSTHKSIDRLCRETPTRACYDWNAMLGGSVSEKYQSLYFKLTELTNLLIQGGTSGYFWVVTSPEIAGIIESFGALESRQADDYIPMGLEAIQYVGTLNNRWRIYSDISIGKVLLLGAHANPGSIRAGTHWDEIRPQDCAFVRLSDFFI